MASNDQRIANIEVNRDIMGIDPAKFLIDGLPLASKLIQKAGDSTIKASVDVGIVGDSAESTRLLIRDAMAPMEGVILSLGDIGGFILNIGQGIQKIPLVSHLGQPFIDTADKMQQIKIHLGLLKTSLDSLSTEMGPLDEAVKTLEEASNDLRGVGEELKKITITDQPQPASGKISDKISIFRDSLIGRQSSEILHDISPVLLRRPIVVSTLSLLDMGCQSNLRICAYADPVAKDRFYLNYGGWADTTIYASGATSIIIPSESLGIQAGVTKRTALTMFIPPMPPFVLTTNFGPRSVDIPIKFMPQFDKSPKVMINLVLLDVNRAYSTRIFAEARTITSEGFKLHFETWADSTVHSVQASWIAVPQDESRIQTGTDIHGPTWAGVGERVNKKQINFEKPFENIPEVVVSLSGLDSQNNVNTRINVNALNITNNGFVLEYKTWADSQITQIRANWIAIDKNLIATSK
jgi:hypothetical protein